MRDKRERRIVAILRRQLLQRRFDATNHRLDEAGMVEVLPEPIDRRRAFTHFDARPLDGIEVLTAAGDSSRTQRSRTQSRW